MAIRTEKLLIIRSAALILAVASFAAAQPAIDNVLERMVPPGSTSLVGAHMERIKQTDFYRKYVAAEKMPQVDEFARDTGFDPRRDVRELLYVETPRGSVLLARGTFHINSGSLTGMQKTRHGDYDVWGRGTGGFCILDSTLAVAGDMPAITAALDEWKSGTHTGAQPLLARVASINPQAQFWGISTGVAGFLAEHPPAVMPGLDFSRIFAGLRDTWFEVDLTSGLKAEVHGTTATEKDAISLRDAVRGLVGFGRLQVPQNQPELLKVWDGITVDQDGKSIAVDADIPQDLVDKLIQMLTGGQKAPQKVI